MIDEVAMPESVATPTTNEPNVIQTKSPTIPKPNARSIAVRSLKQLQNETRTIEVEFFERVYQLETEFQKRHELVYQKRCDIVNGDYIPTEAEGLICDNDDVAHCTDQKSTKSEIDLQETSDYKVSPSGVSHFWLNVLTATIAEIHENDRPILEHLTDVRSTNKPLSDLGFVLEFHFSPNEYFENAVLTKEYFYTSSDNKMIHEIPLIRQSVGSEIKWKNDKAPTYRSWFDFLASSKVISNSEEEFMSYISGIQKDFEMGYFIKEHVIPRAALYFTGEESIVFNIGNYNSGFWSASMSSTSSESVASEDGSKSGSENRTEKGARDQREIVAEDELKA